VQKLGGILRVADSLDRSHESSVSDVRARETEGQSAFRHGAALDCESELLEADRKRELFEQAFQCELEFSVRRVKAREVESQAMVPSIKAKHLARIDCDGPAHAGITQALSRRLEEMCSWRGAALDWSDPEGVHKMRVASRRLRGALRDFAPPWETPILLLLKQLRDRSGLGRVRDNDGRNHDSGANGGQSTGGGRGRNSPPGSAFETSTDRTPSATYAAARSRIVIELTARFKEELDRAPLAQKRPSARPSRKSNRNDGGHVSRVGSSIILARLDELEQLSNNLYQPLKIKPLHRLRIGVKHLRYALQLFEQCWDAPSSDTQKKQLNCRLHSESCTTANVWIEDLGQDGQQRKRES